MEDGCTIFIPLLFLSASQEVNIILDKAGPRYFVPPSGWADLKDILGYFAKDNVLQLLIQTFCPQHPLLHCKTASDLGDQPLGGNKIFCHIQNYINILAILQGDQASVNGFVLLCFWVLQSLLLCKSWSVLNIHCAESRLFHHVWLHWLF